MDPKELQELQAAYQSMYEAKAESSEKEEEDRKEDDDLAGSPNAKKNGKKKAKRWWDDDGDGKGYEKGEVKEGVVKKEVKALQKAGNTLSPKAAAKADDEAGVASRKGLPEETLVEKQKDTPLQVAAVIDKDRAKKATDDATYDRMHGKNKQADEDERYSKWERYKMKRDAQRSGHPWKHAKGSTTEKEGKKSEKSKHVYDPLHNKEDKDWGYDSKGQSKNPDDIAAREVKELQKAGKTLKDTPVVKADKTANPNYKGQKFGVKEEDDWIQKAVKRPGAFTRKAKAAGQTVQQFAKTVDDNPEKYSTRTKRQANLAQTFASMKKEDVEELFYTLIVD